ncbi:MAG: hypothetical protein B6D37_12145 [Sphingobacteriales bacterium UTBCD1]|jgi:hypothetical protein|nr:MAG: hypothetical protein B6D37_12145 [Sphingobacteriales bacterium UTBCD1]
MPFTFSHPGAVLPLGYLPRRYFSMTALVIGSIAPDFEYFFRMAANSYYSHRWSGLFWFDLPLVIVLAFVYHEVVRDKLIDNLPAILAKRLQAFKKFNWPAYFKKNVPVVIVSAIIGTASHILWDAFTHEQGIFNTEFERLKEIYNISNHHRFATYNLLQLISSIAGMLIVLYALLRLPPDKNYKRTTSILPFWSLIIVVTLMTLGIRLLTGLHLRYYRNVVMTVISGSLIGLLLASIFFPGGEKNKA